MRESHVEKAVCAFATRHGWITLKLNGAGARGKPDRLFLKDGRAVFAEIKAPGKRPTALQARFIERLRAAGFTAAVIDSVEAGEALLAGEGVQI